MGGEVYSGLQDERQAKDASHLAVGDLGLKKPPEKT